MYGSGGTRCSGEGETCRFNDGIGGSGLCIGHGIDVETNLLVNLSTRKSVIKGLFGGELSLLSLDRPFLLCRVWM